MEKEKLTVLMTTYNENNDVLRGAIDSILTQSYSNFKFLIVVDNPENMTAIELLNDYCEKDSRIRILINEQNLGLPKALNRGIEAIDTEFIARMDADDIALPNRFELQMSFLEKNPQVDIIGTNIVYMDQNGNYLSHKGKIPTGYNFIKKVMRCANIYNHPTYMGKTEIFRKYKYRNLKYSQDYDFMCRLIENSCIVDNIPDYLLQYRQVNVTNIEKRVRRKVIYYCIQNCYKNKTLTNTDIEKLAEETVCKVDKEKLFEAMNLYDIALEELKSHKYMSGFKNMMKSFFASPIIRAQVMGLIRYQMLKIVYKR